MEDPAIIALHLVTRTDTVQTETTENQSWLQRFPKVFSGLGNLSGDYTIQLKSDERPHAILTPRHIPFLLRQQVADELNQKKLVLFPKCHNQPLGVQGW